MDKATLRALEFPAVIAELKGLASIPPGADVTGALEPCSDRSAVEKTFAELKELSAYYKVEGKLPLGGTEDIRPLLAEVEPEGAYLLAEEILVIRGNLEASRAARALLNSRFRTDSPLLTSIMETLSDQRLLASEIDRTFDEKGWIRDEASGELYRIRSEIRSVKERARAFLDRLAGDENTREFLQEDIITIRDDRYVLCVKAGKHTNIRGVVHGRSGSGASFFIEPLEIVELNNNHAVLRKEERAEEVRILRDITRFILDQKDFLVADQDVLAGLDSLQARVLFAEKVGALVPELAADGLVKLIGARHPLLVLKEISGGPPVIPVDIMVEPGCRVLVISGANTGGKTVALKTLGLLTVMTLSGIPVPVEEGSAIVLFESVFSDIGDSQNIEASLSTFSAHVQRMKGFLASAGAGSLVLIDEIGAGTNPAEGGALAMAAIEAFRRKGALVVVTTHLNLLKAHAQTDPGYINASVEFDEDTLKPLYRLRYGVPGSSLGLSIARSLGLPGEIIDTAIGLLDESENLFVESVKRLDDARAEVEEMRDRLNLLESRRDEAVRKFRGERERMLEKARKRVEDIVEKARAEIRKASAKASKETTALTVRTGRQSVERAAREALKGLGEKKKKLYIPEVGDRAGITGSTTRGEVVRVDREGKKAELRVGSLKVWVPWEKLTVKGKIEKRERSPMERKGSLGRVADDIVVGSTVEPTTSINIIGKRTEEALPVVTRFLDAAHAGGLEKVEIIHGLGTGALMKAVHGLLAETPFVRDFHRGDPDHGGAGVTVVELA